MGVVIVGKKQLEIYIQETLQTSYTYLKNVLAENNIHVPATCADFEKYVNQLNKIKANQRNR